MAITPEGAALAVSILSIILSAISLYMTRPGRIANIQRRADQHKEAELAAKNILTECRTWDDWFLSGADHIHSVLQQISHDTYTLPHNPDLRAAVRTQTDYNTEAELKGKRAGFEKVLRDSRMYLSSGDLAEIESAWTDLSSNILPLRTPGVTSTDNLRRLAKILHSKAETLVTELRRRKL